MTISESRIEPRHEVAANALVNAHTFGIVRDTDNVPVEEVTSAALVRDIATELAAAEARGRVEGLREAAEIASTIGSGQQELWTPWEGGFLFARKDIAAAIDARISALSKAPIADTEIGE